MPRFQFSLCLTVIAWIVIGFHVAELNAQDSAGPKLINPLDGALLDNGRTDRLDVMRWEFEWASIPNADEYRLNVQRKSGKSPLVNTVLGDTRFAKESRNYIIARNQQGWTWKVQARVNGKWSSWSEERTFDVEPLDTDLATIESPAEEKREALSTIDKLSVIQSQHEIDFDKNRLVVEPVASYPRYQPGMASQEHLRFSLDGKYIAIGGMAPWKPIGNGRMSSSSGGRIELWNVESGKQTILSDDIKTFIDPTMFPVAFSQDSKLLVAADTYGQVKIWNLSAEEISNPKVIKFEDDGQNTGIATALSFPPDSRGVLIGAHPTRQFEIESGKEIALCEDHTSSVLEPDVIELSPDGRTIAFGGLSKGIHFFDLISGKFVDTFTQTRIFKEIYYYHFLPSGKFSVVAGRPAFSGSEVVVHNNSTGKFAVTIPFEGEFPVVAVSADGSTLAVSNAKIRKSDAYAEWQKAYQNAYEDEVLPTLISLWRINDASVDYLGQVNAGNKEMVTAIGLSPSGRTLVSSGANLRFWDVKAIPPPVGSKK